MFDVKNPLSGLSGSFGQSPSRPDMPYPGDDNLSERGASRDKAVLGIFSSCKGRCDRASDAVFVHGGRRRRSDTVGRISCLYRR